MQGKIAKLALLIVVLTLLGLQLFQPARSNPTSDPALSFARSAQPHVQVASLVQKACWDCHSNETAWPWYSHVAPFSWLVVTDVKQGRAHLNLSEWGRYSPEMAKIRLGEMCDEVKKGDMPPWQYKLIHSEAKLTPESVNTLCAVTVASQTR